MVVGLTFGWTALDDAASDKFDSIHIIVSSLPNLAYVDLGGYVPTHATLHALTRRPPIRSLLGLKFSARQMDAIIATLESLSGTLEHLTVTSDEDLNDVATRPRFPRVVLPRTTSLEWGNDARRLEDVGVVLSSAIRLPNLQTYAINMSRINTPNATLFGGLASYGWAGSSTPRQTTCPARWLWSGPRDRGGPLIDLRAEVLVVRLPETVQSMWWNRPIESAGTFPAVRTLVLIQPAVVAGDRGPATIDKLLSTSINKAAMRSLQEVVYVTEDANGTIWQPSVRFFLFASDSITKASLIATLPWRYLQLGATLDLACRVGCQGHLPLISVSSLLHE